MRATSHLWILFLTLIAACVADDPTVLSDETMATVNDESITAADLNDAFWASSNEEQHRALKRGGRHDLLDRVVDELLLTQEARRRGLQPTYHQMKGLKHRVGKRLLDAEVESASDAVEITDEEVRAEFDRVRSGSESEDRREIELITRPTKLEAAEVVSAIAALEPEDDLDMALLRLRRSGKQGGVFSRSEAENRLGRTIATAAFSLPEEQLLYPEVVKAGEHYAALVVQARFDAVKLAYERAEPQVRKRLVRQRWDRALNQFVESIREEHEVVIFTETMELVPWVGE